MEALREEAYEVSHVADGEEALAWYGRRVGDVLIMDVKLPGGIDGWQIAERCKEEDLKRPLIHATCFSPVAPRAGGYAQFQPRERIAPRTAQDDDGLCPVRVKMRRTQPDRIWSALPY
ncbi:response regulator [Bradyrhizobium japonicum]|uniref:response regulator n=1 Tax=Bradyrhizobium japonicum TaxID=375 RepID=UPI0021687FFE|nr:response regulator [Bradyrhizobium japonicum]